LYRLKAAPELIQDVFLDYFKHINRLVEKPKWYNALTHNCTTTIRGHTRPYTGNRPFDWRLIFNGHLDKMLYDRAAVDTSFPFEKLKAKSYITTKAKLLSSDANFSTAIRSGLPDMDVIK
jgi:hypothetical protein